MNTQHEKLIGLGFSLLWLKEKSKAPIDMGWTKAPKKTLKELQHTYSPGLNTGVRLGVNSNLADGTFLAVIDCDVKSTDPLHLKELEAMLTKIVGVDTPVVLSGRGNGSKHLYIKTPKPLKPFRFAQSSEKIRVLMPSTRPSQNEIEQLSGGELDKGVRLRAAWEISVMGTGQQVVLPPSIHPDTGKEYSWHKVIESLSEIPLVDIKTPERANAPSLKVRDTFTPVEYDLVGGKLNQKWQSMILSGEGVSDRSAALLSATLAMLSQGWDDATILTILSDRDNFLGNAAYEHTKSGNRTKAVMWLEQYTLKKAKDSMSAERDFEVVLDDMECPLLNDAEAAIQNEALLGVAENWRNLLDRTQTGKLRCTYRNTYLVLKYAPDRNYFSRDDFTNVDYIDKDPPWENGPRHLVSNKDALYIKRWLTFNFNLEPTIALLFEAIDTLSCERRFHPVRDFLDGLSWDGTERLTNWAKDYLRSTSPEIYLREVSRLSILAMVKRIYEPGCKFDSVIILEGDQGIGKSTAARTLAGEWFSDMPLRFDKDGVLGIQGHWVIELGELSVMSRGDVNQLKEFISHQFDKVRPPFERKIETYPRQCIFIGTTNNEEYLKDKTGNRRYLPIKVGQVDIKGLRLNRDQLLAEAVWEYKNFGAQLYLEGEALDIAQCEQHARLEIDYWSDEIDEILNDSESLSLEGFALKDLVTHPKAHGLSIKTRADQMRISDILKSKGYQKRHTMKGKIWSKFRKPMTTMTTMTTSI